MYSHTHTNTHPKFEYFTVNGPANAPHVPNQNQYGRPMPNQTQFPQGNYPTPPSPHMHGAYKGGAGKHCTYLH